MMNPHFGAPNYSQNPSQYQDIFIQYKEGFNIVTGKASVKFKDVHMTIPDNAPFVTPYTKANIRNLYVIFQESQDYRKSEKYEIFCRTKLVWCCTP